jgi:hypothetical protein
MGSTVVRETQPEKKKGWRGSKSAQGQKPGQEASQRRRKRLRHDLARGFHDYSRAEGPLRQTKAAAAHV